MIELKHYQRAAVDKLTDRVKGLLVEPQNQTCIFQAPTGSGKTLMVAEFLRKLVREYAGNNKLSFIWISVRQLHDQSKDKLERYYEGDRLLKCSYFEDLDGKRIGENEILFVNWDSINKKDINVYVRPNEQENNLSNVIENTKEDGRQILLIIDESHHTASSEKSRELILAIAPKVTLEVSATPHLQDLMSEIVKVDLVAVKDEEMIKSEITVNPGFADAELGSQSTDEFVISEALNKREKLARQYKREGSNVNPLALVQLPDRREGLEDKKDEIVSILHKLGINEQNGKLAIWLSEDKSDTLPNIEKNDNAVEVLVFKTAIALGWDCPRASILVIFRESKSFQFTIQTIGRIMRMPEMKYYDDHPELNKGFVYTNLSNINIAEDYAKDYITVYESKRRNDAYHEVKLPSVYLKRQRERTRLAGEFVGIFSEVAAKNGLQKIIRLNPSKIVDPVMTDGKITDVDKLGEIAQGGVVEMALTESEVQGRFDRFIRDSCSPFAPVDSSDRMKTALYTFFEGKLGLERFDPQVQRIVLGRENIHHFVDSINQAKGRYVSEVVVRLGEKRERQEVPSWEVPLLISYNSLYSKRASPTSIMAPLYVRDPSEPERDFMHLLDHSGQVDWWFRNGENEIKYFAVYYEDKDRYSRAFYPDFIIKFKDSSIGVFDTKKGITASEAGPRARGLWEFIRATTTPTRRIWGGIVIHENNTWMYNDNEEYIYDPPVYSRWKALSLV
jgi:type III restriction enzyme